MAIIDVTTLLGVADRAATQYGMFIEPFSDINDQGSGFYWELITATDDPDVESYLMPSYYIVDKDFDVNYAFKYGLPALQLIVTSMDGYFNANGFPGLWDSYLKDNDVRVSDYFNKVIYASKSSYLLANNVFSEDQNNFGNWEYGDIFTDGIDYGDGSWNNRADGNYFAATQLKVIIDTGSTACNSLVLKISVKDKDNNPTSIDTGLITGNEGDEFDVGVLTDRFLDVTNIVVVSGDLVGNKVRIENKKERQVVL